MAIETVLKMFTMVKLNVVVLKCLHYFVYPSHDLYIRTCFSYIYLHLFHIHYHYYTIMYSKM